GSASASAPPMRGSSPHDARGAASSERRRTARTVHPPSPAHVVRAGPRSCRNRGGGGARRGPGAHCAEGPAAGPVEAKHPEAAPESRSVRGVCLASRTAPKRERRTDRAGHGSRGCGMRAAQARRPVGLPALLVVFLAAVGWLVACAARSPGARAYPELVRFAGREIEDVDFRGGAPFPADTLEALVRTEASRCRILGLPICPFGLGEREEFLDLNVLRSDAVRLALFFRQSGFFGTQVEPEVEEAGNG